MRFILSLLFLCSSLLAADRVTLTVTVTNAPTDSDTLTVNTDTRTWLDTVTDTTAQIQTTNSIVYSATNLYYHLAATPFSGPTSLQWADTNSFRIIGSVGQTIAASSAGTWVTLTSTTQSVSSVSVVRVPMASVSVKERTNNATLLVTALDDYALTAVDDTATAWSSLVNVAQAQTITGAKIFTNIITTNLANYGNAISSPGSATDSEQFGTGASASGLRSIAIGKGSSATATDSMAIGTSASTTNTSAISIGVGSTAKGTAAISIGGEVFASYGIALGSATEITGAYGIAIGDLASASGSNSVAIGRSVSSTADNTIKLGRSVDTVDIDGLLTATAITNSTYHGTVGKLTSGYWSAGTASALNSTNTVLRGTNVFHGIYTLPRTDYTSLANGNNAGVDFGTATYIKIDSGPTAAFAICGIAGGADGRLLILDNQLGYNLTIANDSGVDGTAANRIYTTTGSDMASTTKCVVMLLYDSEDSRWHVVSFQD